MKLKLRAKELSPATLVGLTIALLLPIPPYRQPFLHLLMTAWGLSWISAWESIGLISKLMVIVVLPLLVVDWERRKRRSIGVRALSLRDFLAAIAIFLAFLLVSPRLTWMTDKIPAVAAQLTVGSAMYASLPRWLDWSGLLAKRNC
jgi:hypothetical protein